MSNTNQKKLQSFQNGNIQQIHNRHLNNRLTAEQIHNTYKLDPINTRMYNRTKKTWEKFEEINPELVTTSNNINTNEIRDHFWWRRIASYLQQEEPNPQY